MDQQPYKLTHAKVIWSNGYAQLIEVDNEREYAAVRRVYAADGRVRSVEKEFRR